MSNRGGRGRGRRLQTMPASSSQQHPLGQNRDNNNNHNIDLNSPIPAAPSYNLGSPAHWNPEAPASFAHGQPSAPPPPDPLLVALLASQMQPPSTSSPGAVRLPTQLPAGSFLNSPPPALHPRLPIINQQYGHNKSQPPPLIHRSTPRLNAPAAAGASGSSSSTRSGRLSVADLLMASGSAQLSRSSGGSAGHGRGYSHNQSHNGNSVAHRFSRQSASTTAANQASVKTHFSDYYPRELVDQGLRSGELIQGVLRVNQRNYEEAYLDSPDGEQDILIYGLRDRNRSFHGDIVVVRLKHRQHWVVQESLYELHKTGTQEKAANDEDRDSHVSPSVTESDSEVSQLSVTHAGSESSACQISAQNEQPQQISDQRKYSRGKMIGYWNEVDTRPALNVVDNDVVCLLKYLGLSRTIAQPKRVQPPQRATIPHNRRLVHDSCSQQIKQPLPNSNRELGPGGASTMPASFSRRYKTVLTFGDAAVPDHCLQRTAEVVYISDMKNSRCAVGTLKTTNDGAHHFMLFSPVDSRVPRMMVSGSEAPANFFERPQDYAQFIFIGQVAEWPVTAPFPRGTLYKTLGVAGEIEPETEGLLCQYQIDTRQFSTECLQCLPQVQSADTWTIPEEEYSRRRSFCSELVFTIDPRTARDLDDALHIKLLDNGLIEVGVHIADVSYFVQADTELDKWAQARATSTYLVHKVVHMLPRLLCEQLCSLNAQVERLAVSVVWKMDTQGNIQHQWFGRSIIRSAVKLSYEHAQSMIEEPSRDWLDSELPEIAPEYTASQISTAVNQLHKMGLVLKERRFNNGSLRLDQPKLTFALDQDTQMPQACAVYERKDSNSLVEEFMLLANQSAAKHIYKHFPQSAVLRRHPPPNAKVMREVMSVCASLGLHMDCSSSASLQQCMQSLCNHSHNTHLMPIITQLLMKPMRLAQYFCTGVIRDECDFAHYALSVPFYTHFTSPIRRYPDIMVHRLLVASLDQDKAGAGTVTYTSSACAVIERLSAVRIQAIATHCNERKLAAKTVSEMSSEMFFALFVKKCGPIETPAVVMNVMDHSFDVLLVKYGIVKRVYANRLDLSGDATFVKGPPAELRLHWNMGADQDHSNAVGSRTQTQTIRMCSCVTAVVTAMPDALKLLTVIHAKYDECNTTDPSGSVGKPNEADQTLTA